MAFRDGIRTIAETDSIIDRLDKADKNNKSGPGTKDGIPGVKSVATDAAGGIFQYNDQGNAVTGTDNTGAEAIGPLASSLDSIYKIEPELVIALRDALLGVGYQFPQPATNKNDLSGAGKSYLPNSSVDINSPVGDGGGTSRTDALAQALPGTTGNQTDQDWTAIEAGMTAGGASSETIAGAKRDHYATEDGRYDVADVYNGDSNLDINVGRPSTIPGDPRQFITTDRISTLDALVGTDPTDHTLGLMVRFDGQPILPSDAEAAAGGQNPWTSLTEGPALVRYEHGFYWSDRLSSPNTHIASTPDPVAAAWLTYTKTVLPGAYPTGFDDAFLTGTVTYSAPDWLIGYKQGAPAPEQFLQVYQEPCVGITSYCPATAPTENFYPAVGLYQLEYNATGVTSNPFDSEVPLAYTQPKAAVLIRSELTGDVYAVKPAVEGGFTLENQTNPDYFLFFDSTRSLRAVAPISAVKFYRP